MPGNASFSVVIRVRPFSRPRLTSMIATWGFRALAALVAPTMLCAMAAVYPRL